MHQLISETLDPDLIARQCARGVFSYESFFRFMATVLPKLCAPVRDPEVRALADDLQAFGSLDEMIEKLFRVFHMIDVLALDYSNFLLANVAPRLVRSAPTYEQTCFRKDVEEGRVTLVRTRRWWNNATVNALTDASNNVHPGSTAAGRRPTMAQIYARGLVDLALAAAPLADEDVPETLELDRARISAARDAATRIAVVGAIVLGAKNLLKRDVRQPWRAEAARMMEILRAARFGVGERPEEEAGGERPAQDTAARLLGALESAHALPPATRATLANTIARLLGQPASSSPSGSASSSSSSSSPSSGSSSSTERVGILADPVARLLHSRLKTHVLARLAAAQDSERARARAAGGAGASLAGAGLTEFGAEVGALVEGLGRVAELDRLGHGVWYEEIAGEGGTVVLREGEEAEAAVV
jgi:hypothetical protein